ncbi:MAG: hypothetical protein BGO69_14435 [Bacteroidetes bacterium 46-16]|nr:MAG: hypothetical protein BGO69_14435 [Bacteroidetes bacterium 46-16]
MKRVKEPLYRKYNKLARGFHHNSLGGAFRYQRNTKEVKNFEGTHMSVRRTREGYDYTPLFKFLLSRAGQNWDKIFSEAVQRLDKQEPIFWLVDLHFEQGDYGVVSIGENSYYSKLTVQDDLLVLADPKVTAPAKLCTCCTHTFNGIAY